jgi:hypothetical protein
MTVLRSSKHLSQCFAQAHLTWNLHTPYGKQVTQQISCASLIQASKPFQANREIGIICPQIEARQIIKQSLRLRKAGCGARQIPGGSRKPVHQYGKYLLSQIVSGIPDIEIAFILDPLKGMHLRISFNGIPADSQQRA